MVGLPKLEPMADHSRIEWTEATWKFHWSPVVAWQWGWHDASHPRFYMRSRAKQQGARSCFFR